MGWAHLLCDLGRMGGGGGGGWVGGVAGLTGGWRHTFHVNHRSNRDCKLVGGAEKAKEEIPLIMLRKPR